MTTQWTLSLLITSAIISFNTIKTFLFWIIISNTLVDNLHMIGVFNESIWVIQMFQAYIFFATLYAFFLVLNFFPVWSNVVICEVPVHLESYGYNLFNYFWTQCIFHKANDFLVFAHGQWSLKLIAWCTKSFLNISTKVCSDASRFYMNYEAMPISMYQAWHFEKCNHCACLGTNLNCGKSHAWQGCFCLKNFK